MQSLKTSAELTDWLKSQKLAFTTKQEQDASEQLPPDRARQAGHDEGRRGRSSCRRSPASRRSTLVSSASAPKPLADARPAIEQFLANQGRRELMMNLQKTHSRRRQGGIPGPLRGAGAGRRRRCAAPLRRSRSQHRRSGGLADHSGPKMKLRSASQLSLTLVCVAALLAACGKKTDDTSAAVATVNGEKITQDQLDFAIKQIAAARPGASAPEAATVLQGLVEQRLAVQKAEKDKLDRNPGVLQVAGGRAQGCAGPLLRRAVRGQGAEADGRRDQAVLRRPSGQLRRSATST